MAAASKLPCIVFGCNEAAVGQDRAFPVVASKLAGIFRRPAQPEPKSSACHAALRSWPGVGAATGSGPWSLDVLVTSRRDIRE
jgi:hypothetical protein